MCTQAYEAINEDKHKRRARYASMLRTRASDLGSEGWGFESL